MPFPNMNNYNLASIGSHFHIELSDVKQFVNPFTLKLSSVDFQRTLDGGKSWKKLKSFYF